jgi:hypothetical protein
LETIGGEPVAQWVTMADWLTRHGMNGSRHDPYTPVLVVAFRGTGYRVSAFLPPGTRNADTAITGLTVAIDGLTGAEIGLDYWFNPPPFEPEHLYIQFLDQWLAAYFPPGATLLSYEPQMMPRFGDMSEYAAVLQRSLNESTYTTEELLSFAKQHARSFGLETISGTPEYYWALHFEYPAGLGGIVSNYRLPVFVAALRGSGLWSRGASGQRSAFEMDGITLVLNGLTGEVIAVTGAYVDLRVPDDAARELE